MKIYLLLLYFLLFVLVYGQEKSNSGIIDGKNHAFALTAPDGWVLDNKSGVKQGIYAVFYKKGGSWEKSESVMYANTASLESGEQKSLDELIRYDIEHFKKNYSDIETKKGKDLKINEKITAKIYYFSGKSYGNY